MRTPQIISALAEILVEAVANGGSVNFLHPYPIESAKAFWESSFDAAKRNERVILGAFDGDELVATVTLMFCPQPNQPHRAEIGKMMTRLSHRGRGIAKTLMQAAEELAIKHNRTLLVLDTAEEEGASKLYESLGFKLAGIIPGFAYKPHGGLTGAMFYWKKID